MEGVLRCVLTCLLGMSAVVMMDTHWMEMECLAMVSVCFVLKIFALVYQWLTVQLRMNHIHELRV